MQAKVMHKARKEARLLAGIGEQAIAELMFGLNTFSTHPIGSKTTSLTLGCRATVCVVLPVTCADAGSQPRTYLSRLRIMKFIARFHL